MEIYGMLQLRAGHSVHPDFVSLDRRGYPYMDLDGCELPPPIKPTDIVGIGEDEIGEEAHILVDFGDGVYDPDESVVYCIDDLDEVREFFS